MKKTLRRWQIAGFVFTSAAGVLLHFLFDWTGGNAFVALFSTVNESIWEHMKILFFPLFFFALIQNRYIGKDYGNFWCVKLFGIVLSVIAVPVAYYTLNGALGTMPDWVNIAIFFVCTAFSYILETWLFNKTVLSCNERRAELLLWAIAVLFAVFTFFPPQLPLFADPISGTYGYNK